MFVNYAHRGASAYAPENTLSSFYLGLRQQANGIETDIQRSKDGVLVLSVRAWGVTTPQLIQPIIESGVDGGMTVNFPDKLAALMPV